MTRLTLLAPAVLAFAACTGGVPATGSQPVGTLPPASPSAAEGSPAPTSGSPIPSVSRAPGRATPGPTPRFYLRAWTTQALPPPAAFTWLPILTVADGRVIDGNVVIDMMYPGPMIIVPFERELTDVGGAAIIAEARRFGLLDDVSDLTGGMLAPGSTVAHIEMVVDGVRRESTGDPSRVVVCGPDGRCPAEPGTPDAFSAFWQQLTSLDAWLADELSAPMMYEPERLAVVAQQPPAVDPNGPRPQLVAWPLSMPFSKFGKAFAGDAGARCATLSAEDVQILLPALEAANQLTIFLDAEDAARSLVARVLVPGEDSPCGVAGG